MTMSKDEFYDLIDEIDNKLFVYSKNKVALDTFCLTLSSGEHIKIRIPESSVAHLLGLDNSEELIKVGKIQRAGYFRTFDTNIKSTYPLLKHLTKVKDLVYGDMDSFKPSISAERLFSKHIEKKLAGFATNIDINANGIDWICKYSKIKATAFTGSAEPFHYFLRRSNENGEVFILGLRYSSDEKGVLCPVSNRYYSSENNPEYLEYEAKILAGQSIAYPTFSSVYYYGDYHDKTSVEPEEKVRKRLVFEETTKRLFRYYGMQAADGEEIDHEGLLPILNEFGVHGWSLKKFMEGVATGAIPKRFAYKIASRMAQAEKVTARDLNVSSFNELDESLKMILVGYNRSIEAARLVGDDKETFLEATKLIETQSEEITSLNERIADLEGELAITRSSYEGLKSEHKKYVKTLGTIYDAMESSGFKKE